MKYKKNDKVFKIVFKLALSIALFSLQIGCNKNPEPSDCNLSNEEVAAFEELESLVKDTSLRNFHKDVMKSNFNEPSIFDAKRETYRLRITCSGNSDYTKIVRLTRGDNGLFRAVIKEFKGKNYPLIEADLVFFELTDSLNNLFSTHIEESNFWTNPQTEDHRIIHGCFWNIEAYRPIKHPCTGMHHQLMEGIYPLDPNKKPLYKFMDSLEEYMEIYETD